MNEGHEQEMDADYKAREIAYSALAKIEAHERVCVERHTGIQSTLARIENIMAAHSSRFWVAQSGIIVLLLGICGFLIRARFFA